MRRWMVVVVLLASCGGKPAKPLAVKGPFTLKSCESSASAVQVKARVTNSGKGMANYVVTVGLISDGKRIGQIKFTTEHVPAGKHVDGETMSATAERPTCRIETIERVPVKVIHR